MSKTAKCDRTKKDIELSKGFLVADPKTGEWYFLSKDAPEEVGDYNVPVAELLKSPETFVDWMAHLNEKSWFRPKEFFQLFDRLRSENNLYGHL